MIISANTIVTGDGATVLQGFGVRLRDGKISAVGKVSELIQEAPGEEHLDYGDATILPGMIDMHVHLGYYQGRADEALYTDHLKAYQALSLAQRMLQNGVTTIRDAFCPNAVCRQLILAAKKGFVRDIPRIFHCNRTLTISGGLDWNVDGSVQVDGPEAIRKAVREELREGADWIKAMASWRTPGVAEFDKEELNMIVRETHRLNHKAMAHATLQPALQMCIDAGFDTIEHGTDLTVGQGNEMRERGIGWVPTIYVHKAIHDRLKKRVGEDGSGYGSLSDREKQTYNLYSGVMETYRKNFLDVYKTGVLTMAGTDCPFDGLEHITVAWELECMVGYGVGPVEAIATATGNSAKMLDMEGEIGLLAPGATADIAIAEGNAAKDITALQRIREVYQGGRRVTGRG
jgi:imidazolonepropionase-like amidohydrolase